MRLVRRLDEFMSARLAERPAIGRAEALSRMSATSRIRALTFLGALAAVLAAPALAQTPPPAASSAASPPASAAAKPAELPQDYSRLATAYKQLAADNAAQLKNFPPLAGAQISPLREARAPQPGAFMACLRTVVMPGDFAVFFDDAVTIRRAVAIDRCGQASYAALPPPRNPIKPAETAAARPARQKSGKASLFR